MKESQGQQTVQRKCVWALHVWNDESPTALCQCGTWTKEGLRYENERA